MVFNETDIVPYYLLDAKCHKSKYDQVTNITKERDLTVAELISNIQANSMTKAVGNKENCRCVSIKDYQPNARRQR